jgi:hypothetical protein
MGVQVALSYPEACSFGYMPWRNVTGAYSSIVFSFLRELYTTFHSGCTNYTPTNSVEVFLFPTSSPVFVVIYVIDDCHSDWDEVESQSHFDLHFLLAKDVEHFLCSLAIRMSSFVYCLFISFAHLFSGFLIL